MFCQKTIGHVYPYHFRNIKDCKRNSLEAMAKTIHTDYQKLQYFFSDSKWGLPAMKQKRLKIIGKQRTIAPTKEGLLTIDTGRPNLLQRIQKRPNGNIAAQSKIGGL